MPSTNGSRMGLSSHSRATPTKSAATQKTMLRCIAHPLSPLQSMPGAERVHMADPLSEIEGDREQGQDGHRRDGQLQRQHGFEAESMLPKDQSGQHDLRHRIGFGDE